MVKNEDKDNSNSSNSLVFGRWPGRRQKLSKICADFAKFSAKTGTFEQNPLVLEVKWAQFLRARAELWK